MANDEVASHTLTPWSFDSAEWATITESRHTRVVSRVSPEQAEAIRRAVNAHDKLVAAVKRARDALAAREEVSVDQFEAFASETVRVIDEALAAAEGKPQ